MKVYVQKYANKAGFAEIEVEDEEYVSDGFYRPVDNRWCMIQVGRDCFLTKEGALADAEKKRVSRITSLRKQLAKLENLSHAPTQVGAA